MSVQVLRIQSRELSTLKSQKLRCNCAFHDPMVPGRASTRSHVTHTARLRGLGLERSTLEISIRTRPSLLRQSWASSVPAPRRFGGCGVSFSHPLHPLGLRLTLAHEWLSLELVIRNPFSRSFVYAPNKSFRSARSAIGNSGPFVTQLCCSCARFRMSSALPVSPLS